MKLFKLGAGLAIGYVLGSRAGRDKYDQIAAAARKAQTHPAVTQVQQKAKELIGSASVAHSADDDADAVSVPTITPSAGPVPGPPRRKRTTAVTAPDLAADPLA